MSQQRKATDFAEDQDLDSGFCSSTISGPLSEALFVPQTVDDKKEQQESEQEKSDNNKKNLDTKQTKKDQTQQHQQKVVETEENMDSAYFDSGAMSTDLANLSIEQKDEQPQVQQQQQQQSSQYEVYFQTNDEGDT